MAATESLGSTPAGVPRRRETLAAAARRPYMGRLVAAFGLFNVSELGSWVAITALAHDVGGVDEASVVLMVVLAPSAVAAAAVGSLSQRLGTRAVFVGGLAVQGLALAAIAVLDLAGAAPASVYAAALVASLAMVTGRPTTVTLLPVVAPDPRELSAANVILGWVESLGFLVGPLLTGICLTWLGRPWSFAVFAGCCALAAVVAGTGPAPSGARAADEEDPASGIAALGGVLRSRGPRAALVVLGVQGFVNGTIDLLFVVVAVDVVMAGPGGAGWLSAAFGVGAVLGGLGSSVLVGRRWIWPVCTASGVVMVAAVAVLGEVPGLWAAVAAFVLSGASATLLVVATRTVLQRVASFQLLAHTFSLVESAEMLMLFLGAAAVPVLVAVTSVELMPLCIGVVGALVLVVGMPALARAERRDSVPFERVEAISAVSLFALLPADSLSALAAAAHVVRVPAGATLFRQGDLGDRYYVVVSGRMGIHQHGGRIKGKGPGEGFGEFALMRDAPRSATLVAEEDTELLAVSREDFRTAVLGHAPTLAQVEEVAEEVGRTIPGP